MCECVGEEVGEGVREWVCVECVGEGVGERD